MNEVMNSNRVNKLFSMPDKTEMQIIIAEEVRKCLREHIRNIAMDKLSAMQNRLGDVIDQELDIFLPREIEDMTEASFRKFDEEFTKQIFKDAGNDNIAETNIPATMREYASAIAAMTAKSAAVLGHKEDGFLGIKRPVYTMVHPNTTAKNEPNDDQVIVYEPDANSQTMCDDQTMIDHEEIYRSEIIEKLAEEKKKAFIEPINNPLMEYRLISVATENDQSNLVGCYVKGKIKEARVVVNGKCDCPIFLSKTASNVTPLCCDHTLCVEAFRQFCKLPSCDAISN